MRKDVRRVQDCNTLPPSFSLSLIVTTRCICPHLWVLTCTHRLPQCTPTSYRPHPPYLPLLLCMHGASNRRCPTHKFSFSFSISSLTAMAATTPPQSPLLPSCALQPLLLTGTAATPLAAYHRIDPITHVLTHQPCHPRIDPTNPIVPNRHHLDTMMTTAVATAMMTTQQQL